MPYATVTSKGQITIPIEVRNDLELKAGDKILFAQGDNGVYLMIAKNKSVKRLKGMFGEFHRTVSIEEMNETIARAGAGLPEPEEEFAETL